MTALCGHCYKGRLAVDINGDAFPCVFARAFPVGNVREGLSRPGSIRRIFWITAR